MEKVKITADILLSIFKDLINDEDINCTITDQTAPQAWQGKKLLDILNIDYYTFSHTPEDTEQIVRELIEQSESPDTLFALTRAFCLLSKNPTERVFSKDTDIIKTSASLEFWIQAEKIKLLENLIEDLSVATNGLKVPIQIGNATRRAMIVFSPLDVSEIQEATEFGGMAVAGVTMEIVLHPKITGFTDYTVEFLVSSGRWVKVPLTGLSFTMDMTQKSMPKMNQPRNVGNMNLSRVKTVSLTFDGYENEFVEDLAQSTLASDISLEGDDLVDFDNNQPVITRITRNGVSHTYDFVIKSHKIILQDDSGHEVHNLVLTTGGNDYGAA